MDFTKIPPVLPDIKPQTEVATLDREALLQETNVFSIRSVSVAVGMQPTFIRKVCGRKTHLSGVDVLQLLDQDSFRETVASRSKVHSYLLNAAATENAGGEARELPSAYDLVHGNAVSVVKSLPKASIQCVVTSTPYWGLRIYKEPRFTQWADGELCPYGHEQTPEGFLRHTTEMLAALFDVVTEDGSIWWNVMDTFNTRTQIRGNAAEALRAMQGKDTKSWGDHECRRYSAGHSYLKDGEQCMLPALIAERASRIGFYVKSMITWAKPSTLPEPQESRVSRSLEYILHLTKSRTPLFNKDIYRKNPAALGGRNIGSETDKLSDVWTLQTSSGRDGHGAQFPLALPARCIALTTNDGDVVLDPFVGAGTSGIAARALGRRFIGVDVSEEYLATAARRLADARPQLFDADTRSTVRPESPGTLL